MVTAIILINTEHGRINEVAEQIASFPGVSEVYSVGGRIDLIALIRVKTNDEMADLVTNQMLKVEGIQKTETHIAFRAFSRHDLESMFSIGFEA
jgi:DNA-binding Lrp family transcriptional regulator